MSELYDLGQGAAPFGAVVTVMVSATAVLRLCRYVFHLFELGV